jgi:hypothetical protein
MGIGVSIILIAVGAVLAFAVHVTTSGFNVHTVGNILLVVGIIGALISLMFWSSWGGFGNRTVVEEGASYAPAHSRRGRDPLERSHRKSQVACLPESSAMFPDKTEPPSRLTVP